MNTTTRILLAAALCATMAACTKKAKETPPTDNPPPPVAQTAPVDDGKYGPEDLDTDSCLRQRVVYFDFDKSEIRAEFQNIMNCHGKYLRDRPSARITLEGHADERGTREYNLGLGERRSGAVGTALGSASQLTNVSYGEERPTCTDSNDDCWGKNRRVEIVYTAK